MSWKDQIQVLDLEPGDKLELTCKKCGHSRYLKQEELIARKNAARLWLSEVEKRAKCRQRGCSGAMRMAWPNMAKMGAFTGGIA